MPSICKTWSITGDKRITGLCSMKMLRETARVMRGGCPICVDPVQGLGNCANCLVPPPDVYNVTISVVPTKTITYYRWLPEYADLGLVESPPGWTAVLVSYNHHLSPSSCEYSRSYNLFEVSPCRYESKELEIIVSSLGLERGGFNEPPVYDIQCKTSLPSRPNLGKRKRLALTIESQGDLIRYRVMFRWVTERRDPIFVLNPITIWERERAAVAPDRDCWKPFTSTLTGPPPFVVQGHIPYPVLWSFTILPGAR